MPPPACSHAAIAKGGVMRTLSAVLEHLTGWVFIALTFFTLLQVLYRYGFDSPLIWSEELVRYLCVWLTFLGASALAAKEAHLRLGLKLLSRLPPRLAASVEVLLDVTVCALLVLLTWQGVRFTLLSGILHSPALRIPMWWVWVAVPINGVLMLLFVGHSAMRRLRQARG